MPCAPYRSRYITGLMRQMRSAYSRMLRSLENVPMLSALSTALRLHSSGCRYSASTASCAAAVRGEIREHEVRLAVAQQAIDDRLAVGDVAGEK